MAGLGLFGFRVADCGPRSADVTPTEPTPAGPAAISDYDLDPGADGELTLTINTPPDAGDGAVADDGLGTITGYQWLPPNYSVWFTLAGGSPFTIGDPMLPGDNLPLQIRALGYQGRTGAITTTAPVLVPGTAVDVIYVVDSDLNAVFSSSGKRVVKLVPTV